MGNSFVGGSEDRSPKALRRIDGARVSVENPFGLPITLLARSDVAIEAQSVEELLRFASLVQTLELIREHEKKGSIVPFFGEGEPHIESLVITPDFHKGAGIPVGTVVDARGFVIPGAVGNDVCCGMRLLTTDVTPDELTPHLGRLEHRLRELFFRGARNIPMSPRQRRALLCEGLAGLHATRADNAGTGLWTSYDPTREEDNLERVHFGGGLKAEGTFAFDAFIQGSGANDGRDPQIGSVGGGNHFVEIQTVDEVSDGGTARAFGLRKGRVAIMAHSGSVGLGHAVGGYFGALAREVYPKGLPHPKHGFYVIPTRGPHAKLAAQYLSAMRNAANFAFGNRLFLGLMVVRALSEVLGREVGHELVYDAPHNLIWEHEGGQDRFLHRKGATPAKGPTGEGRFGYTGHPVLIPGSMGDRSYVLAGQGREDLLESACHGAGRAVSRGASFHVDEAQYKASMARLRIVTPIDPASPEVQRRRDILEKYHRHLKEEAPYAYKPITPVVQTIEDAGVARRVARLWPLVTVKG